MALYPGTAALKPRVHPGNQDNLSRTHSGCLYWYRSRHYDAARGRFGQADKWGKSIRNTVIHHPFTYVRNNPVIYIDPFGLASFYFGYGAGYASGVSALLTGTAPYVPEVFGNYTEQHNTTVQMASLEKFANSYSQKKYDYFSLRAHHYGDINTFEFWDHEKVSETVLNQTLEKQDALLNNPGDLPKIIFMTTCTSSDTANIFGIDKGTKDRVFIGWKKSPFQFTAETFENNFVGFIARGYTVQVSLMLANYILFGTFDYSKIISVTGDTSLTLEKNCETE
jgi:RHS repeat-associated protein